MSKTVLIVDDEEDALAIATLGLQMKTDWVLLQAGSGQQALDVSAEKVPDLILLDMMMPDMDGKATLAALKANPKTQSIAVILMTAKQEPLTQTGVDPEQVVTVFTKPFHPLSLAYEIRTVLGW
ncbi:MAG: response regulator [Phormidesmis sp.]